MSEGQFVGPSEFARQCGVSRQAIHKATEAGHLVKGAKGYDLKHPTNVAYMAHALSDALSHPEKPERGQNRAKVAEASKKKARQKPDSKKAQKAAKAKKPEGGPKKAAAATKEQVLRAMLDAAGLEEEGLSPQEVMRAIAQKGYWDMQKTREDVLKRQLDRAREVGSVADMRIVESEIGAFGQGIVANFTDSPQRQGMQICQMLGCEGKEKQVIEYLEKDNARRIDEAKRAVSKIKKATLKAMTGKRRTV